MVDALSFSVALSFKRYTMKSLDNESAKRPDPKFPGA